MPSKRNLIIVVLLLVLVGGAYAIYASGNDHQAGANKPEEGGKDEHGAAGNAAEEFERGPHNGRLLRKGDVAVEITIFEDGVPPEFRLYAYEDDKPVKLSDVKVTMELARLDGEVNPFTFTQEGDHLKGSGVVQEPHSFDVKVEAAYEGKSYSWTYKSYEGRTEITPEAAKSSGLETEKAGPAQIRESISLTGRIILNPNATAQVKARFPGIVREVRKNVGDSVTAGEALATVESNDSLRMYPINAPISGVILSRNTNVGDVAGDAPLFVVSNLSNVWAEFHVFSRDVERVKAGQKIRVKTIEGKNEEETTIASLLPTAEVESQTVVARVILDNKEGKWRSGMTVQGEAVVAEREVPLAVKATGLQRFRDFTVVFASVGNRYEVRMLELGASDGEYVEVLSGIKSGTNYVSKNSFLIKADIEKSGASHDH